MTKTTPKLKFRLEVWERAVVFQVLHMDERFRSKDVRIKEYACNNGFTVVSSVYPHISKDAIDLRGEGLDYDFDASAITFDTNEQAENYKQKVLSALTEWSENWEGFQNKATIKEENNIYTV